MAPQLYKRLLDYASKLSKKYRFFDDPRDIVHDAFLLSSHPIEEHVYKAFFKRYTDATAYSQLRKKPSQERTRVCQHCWNELPLPAFTRQGGIRHTCDQCLRNSSTQWAKKNPDRRKEIANASYHRNKHKRTKKKYKPERYQAWRKNHPKKVEAYNAHRRKRRKMKKHS